MHSKQNHQNYPNSLEFYVFCQTNFGEQLRICGNTIQTGNWNPLLGHKLMTDDSTYPQWKSVVPLIVRNNVKLQFKACIVSANRITWQRNIPNRELKAQSPSLLQFVFNQPTLNVISKKVTEIDCRQGTFQIIHEMQSSQTSSIEFKTNYPLQYYFQNESQQQIKRNRKLSDGQLSSNLFSQCEDNIVPNRKQDSEKQFQTIRIKYIRYPQLYKTHSIRQRTIVRKSDESHTCLNIQAKNILKRNKSKTKSIERSQSGSKSKKDEPKSPVLVHIHQNNQKSKSSKKNSNTTKPLKQNSEQAKGSTSTEYEQRSEDNNSTSTVKQYDTEDEYFNTRDEDVVLQSQFSDV